MKIQFEVKICNILAYFNNDNKYTQLKTDRKIERNFLESKKKFYAFQKCFYSILPFQTLHVFNIPCFKLAASFHDCGF